MTRRILIATPTIDGWIHSQHMITVLGAVRLGAELMASHLWAGDMVLMRNRCIRLACESDATHLMFLDDDVSLSGSLYLSLTSSPHAFAAGLYMNARAKYPYHGTPDFNAAGWARVTRVPAGAMVIEIEALRVASRTVPKYVDMMPDDSRVDTPDLCATRRDADNTRLSEDYSLCDTMVAAGFHPHIYGRETACHWKTVPLHQKA
jgi:hypothetical protein